jgi:hypothetical protein
MVAFPSPQVIGLDSVKNREIQTSRGLAKEEMSLNCGSEMIDA